MPASRAYLVVVQLSKTSPHNRSLEDVRELAAVIRAASDDGPSEMCFRSHSGLTFGILILSTREPDRIVETVNASTSFTNADSVLVTELGTACSSLRVSRAAQWIQKSRRSRKT